MMDRIDLIVIAVVAVVVFLIGVLTGRQRREARARGTLAHKVRDIMTTPVVTVPQDATLEKAAETMLERGIGCVLVVNGHGRLSGIVTESDFTGSRKQTLAGYRPPRLLGERLPEGDVEHVYEEARGKTVADVMRRDLITAEEHESVTEAVHRMVERDLRHLPIIRGGIPVGIVTRRDLLRLMVRDAGEG